MAIALWVTLLYLSTGTAVLRCIGWRGGTPFERLVLGAGLGFGLLGNLITVMNFAGLASPTFIVMLLCLLTLCCLPWWVRLLISRPWNRQTGLRQMLFPALIPPALLLVLYFIRTFLPPGGFDALMYHLSCARLFLRHHGFYNIFFNTQSDYPMLSEMNYMIGLALRNDLVCRQIDFFTGLAACGVLVLFSSECGLGRNATSAVCTLFLTLTVVIAAYTNCDVDIAMAAWTALAVFCAMKARQTDSRRALFAAALFTGMALQTKIFGIFALPVVLFAGGLLKPVKWKSTLVAVILPLLMALPWYIKSYHYTGSILSINRSLIDGQGLGLPMGFAVEHPAVRFIINGPLRIIAAPWTFSLMPGQHQQDTLGPLFIVVLPFALIVGVNGTPARLLKLALLYLAEILFMETVFIPAGASIRYTMVLPLLLLPVSVHITRKLAERYHCIGVTIMVMMGIQAACGGLLLVKRYHRDWVALLTRKNRVEYYGSILPQYPAIRYVNNLPRGTKVFTTFNYDNYLINKPYMAGYRSYATSEAFTDDLRRFRVTHVLANNLFDTASNRTALDLPETTITVFSKNGIYVYQLDTTGTGRYPQRLPRAALCGE